MQIDVLASGSKGNCYRVSDGKTSLLLEAGIAFSAIQEGLDYRVNEIAGCLISHVHGDHARAAADLVRRGGRVYGPKEVAERCKGVQYIPTMQMLVVGSFGATPFLCNHDAECYGYLIESSVTGERLVYITDTCAIPHTFQLVDVWMVEANYSLDLLLDNAKNGVIDKARAKRVVDTHMSIDTLAGYFEQYNPDPPKEVWLLHLSDDNSDAAAFRATIEKATGAVVHIA